MRPVALQMDTLNFVHSMTWCPKFLYLKDMAVPQCWWMADSYCRARITGWHELTIIYSVSHTGSTGVLCTL